MASKSFESVDSPGDTANASRRLASILLDQHAHFSDSRNDTTATAESKGGHSMAVTFWMADPPDMSFFSVHCAQQPPFMKKGKKTADFRVRPHVVGAEGRFVCLRAHFFSRYGEDELFMYKAGNGDSPSLDWIPLPADDADNPRVSKVREFGIMPCGHDGSHYLLAALCDTPRDASMDYQLCIYSSEKKTWSAKPLLDPCPGFEPIVPEKVIKIGENVLGWVDFSRGLLSCDLRQDPPDVRYIPLPYPLPENRDKLNASLPDPGASARSFRDLACVNGTLKFIEMELRDIVPSDSNKDFLYDSDLIMWRKRKDVDGKLKKLRSTDGWRAVTWTRAISSTYWCNGCAFDVDDIAVNDSTYSLLSGIRDETGEKLTFRGLYSAFPTLSPDGDDILYLKSVAEPSDRNGWVVAVDLGNKTVKALGVYSFKGHDPSKQGLRLCTLSRHLNIIPGIEVSVYPKITLAASSANDPTSIHEDEPISRETKFLRLMEEINHLQNGEDHVSRVEPVQNNLPPQQCFNKWSYPGYAPSVPAPNLHAYGNYQPLWQQPPPLRQQLTPSSVFGPHEAPQPYFRKWDGARYHGYSQQLSAPTSFAYGTHSDYGNYQQQWQQVHHNQELPACAAWQQPPLVQPQLTPSGVWNP